MAPQVDDLVRERTRLLEERVNELAAANELSHRRIADLVAALPDDARQHVETLRGELNIAEERIRDLESVGHRLLKVYENEWSDGDQQASLRTMRFVLERKKR